MGALVVILLFALVLGLVWALWLRAIIVTGRYPDSAYRVIGRSRAQTVWLILLTGWVGGAYFFLRIRPELDSVERESA